CSRLASARKRSEWLHSTPFAEVIGPVSREVLVMIHVTRRPAHFDRLNLTAHAEPEMEPGIAGRLEAPTPESLGDLGAPAGSDHDDGTDAVPVRPCSLESQRDEMRVALVIVRLVM